FPADGQPADSTGAALSLVAYTGTANAPPTRNFWSDFDYSAFNDGGNLVFHFNLNQIDNLSIGSPHLGPTGAPQVLPNAHAHPAYRFGHDDTIGTAPPFVGQPREFDSNGFFIGRFTQRETSAANFGYPGVMTGNPMHMPNAVNFVNNDPTTGVIQGFSGYRAG